MGFWQASLAGLSSYKSYDHSPAKMQKSRLARNKSGRPRRRLRPERGNLATTIRHQSGNQPKIPTTPNRQELR